ncbi:hypothetical protein ACFQE5_23045 [Pseudonocardia hispaniensis]|uniref:Homeodomain-like domain-containing protein n=1 Tax=Pseudonocardia hispaniensis TaxID=904933 RepID=A0ABW1J880_9PSEU
MADTNPEVMNALVRLMANLDEPSALTDDELVRAVIEAREAKKKAEGTAAAELRRRGWTWPQIGKAIGVDQSTAHGWAQPYLRAGEGEP